jgi:hypothetical protein
MTDLSNEGAWGAKRAQAEALINDLDVSRDETLDIFGDGEPLYGQRSGGGVGDPTLGPRLDAVEAALVEETNQRSVADAGLAAADTTVIARLDSLTAGDDPEWTAQDYPANAVVRHLDRVWMCMNPAQADEEPGVDGKWNDISLPELAAEHHHARADIDANKAEADRIAAEIGDPTLLTTLHPASDLVHWLAWLEARVVTLEAGGSGTTEIVAEGTLEVDNYSGSFERVRDVGNILADDQSHIVNFGLATVAGPGGAIYPTWNDLPTGNGAVWFDNGGQLGGVKGPTGTAVTANTMRQWVKYGRDVAPGTGPTLLRVRRDLTTDAAHPALIVEQIITLTAPA